MLNSLTLCHYNSSRVAFERLLPFTPQHQPLALQLTRSCASSGRSILATMEETTLVESTSPRIEEDTDDSEEMNNFDPKSLPQPLAILTSDVFDDTDEPTGNQCTFYILGTAHVSKASCDDTRRLISVVSPSVVRPVFILLIACVPSSLCAYL